MNYQPQVDNQHVVEQELALIEQALKGDQKAFSQLFFSYKEMVYRVAYRFLGACEDTNDAVQQTFVELHKSLPGYQGKSKFTTWLYRIAINVSIQYLRRRNNKTERFEPDFFPDPGGDKEQMEKNELQKQIVDALKTVHVRKRVVVILHDLEGRTMEEISEIINIPLGTVKSRLFHGRNELRKKLEKVL